MKANTWSSELCSCQSLIANGSTLARLSGATVRINDWPDVLSTSQASMVGTSANTSSMQTGRSNSASTSRTTIASISVAFFPLFPATGVPGRPWPAGAALPLAAAPFMAAARAGGGRAI